MEPVTTVLGGALVAIVSGAVGKAIGSNGKVDEEHCGERRGACSEKLAIKIDNLSKKLDELTDIINSKTFGT